MTMPEKGNEEREFIPEWRRRIEEKKRIVQEFMENLDDDTLFRAALLFMLGNDDAAVLKEMKLDESCDCGSTQHSTYCCTDSVSKESFLTVRN